MEMAALARLRKKMVFTCHMYKKINIFLEMKICLQLFLKLPKTRANDGVDVTPTPTATQTKRPVGKFAVVEKASLAMVTAAGKLGEAAKAADKPAFAAAFQTLGQSCGGCHRNYKEK